MTERTYGISDDLRNYELDVVSTNDVKEYCRLFTEFTVGLLREFDEYSSKEGADIVADGSDFVALSVFATDEQLKEMKREVHKTVLPLTRRTSEDQRLRTMALVLTPPREDDQGGPLVINKVGWK